MRLGTVMKGLCREWEQGAESDLAASRNGANQVKEGMVPLQGRLRGVITSKKRQDAIAGQYQSTVLAAVRHLSKLTAIRIGSALVTELTHQEQLAERMLAGAKRHLERLRSEADDARPGQRLTTQSLVELDVSTEASDQELYERLRENPQELAEKLKNALGCSTSSATRRLVTQAETFQDFAKRVREAFVARLVSVSIVEVIADQLKNSSGVDGLKAIIGQAVVGCQPMWRAESGQANVEFADSMILGIPACGSSTKRDCVVSALKTAASHRIHANGQYNGTATDVTSGDVHRIYIVRRVHGGAFHYLPDVKRAQADYDQWARQGGHPVHIFGPRIVLPSVLPIADVDDGEFEFALALGAGWVAQRGPYWYWNLETSAEDRGKFVCPMTSHWDGLAFASMKRVEGNSLDVLSRNGDVVYRGEETVSGQRIGESLAEAHESVVHNLELIEIVRELFDRLRIAAGDKRVAADLEQYASALRRRTRCGDAHFAMVGEMSDRLTHEVERIRRHQPTRRRQTV
jgi:hypothetical protein